MTTPSIAQSGNEPIHYTQEHPFCSDIGCKCHEDMDLIYVALMVPYDQGWLTLDESTRIYLDTHLAYH